mgnify:CR=1 FL=1
MTHPRQRAAAILVVDDTASNGLLLTRMLSERGYKPQAVVSGELALKAARAEPPDLILLDITMPEMNGYEVCAQLKADPALKDIPVIFISALSETVDKVKAFGVGGVDYVTKPFQFEEVYARVKTHLELRWLERLRDDLTHMIVHDLRNPLTVICSFLDILQLQEADKLSPKTQKFVAVARKNADEVLDMIGSLLDVSKMEAGEMKLQREAFDLADLIRAVVGATQPLSGSRTVTFDATESSPTITADVGLIRRVLQNLLGNAVKYTPAGGDVRLAVTTSDSETRVAVTDAGPGIAPEYHQHIFEKFGQVGARSHRPSSGLGLTFCKLVVEAHGGRIGVESEVGRGSTFWLTLPS